MDESHNLKTTGVVIGQFPKSVLKYGEWATLYEVHARQYDPSFHTRSQEDLSP